MFGVSSVSFNVLMSGTTHKIGSDTTPFFKRSNGGVALFFLRSKNMSGPLLITYRDITAHPGGGRLCPTIVEVAPNNSQWLHL